MGSFLPTLPSYNQVRGTERINHCYGKCSCKPGGGLNKSASTDCGAPQEEGWPTGRSKKPQTQRLTTVNSTWRKWKRSSSTLCTSSVAGRTRSGRLLGGSFPPPWLTRVSLMLVKVPSHHNVTTFFHYKHANLRFGDKIIHARRTLANWTLTIPRGFFPLCSLCSLCNDWWTASTKCRSPMRRSSKHLYARSTAFTKAFVSEKLENCIFPPIILSEYSSLCFSLSGLQRL